MQQDENYWLDKVSLLTNLLATNMYCSTIFLAGGYVSHDVLDGHQSMFHNEIE
jgi:hypothetical protein